MTTRCCEKCGIRFVRNSKFNKQCPDCRMSILKKPVSERKIKKQDKLKVKYIHNS